MSVTDEMTISEMNEITQLAKIFSTVCEKVVEEGKATHTVSVVDTSVATTTARILIVGPTASTWP